MDEDFGVDRAELTGTLISMEFGVGGRIQQLWASDPNLPEEGEDFQFVLPPISFGEEYAEDYYPGTILLGARMNPTEPWILSRNAHAEQNYEEGDGNSVSFEYEFSLLPEISATGRFYEVAGPIPQILWDVRLTNRGRSSFEIGELAFPFALNNLFEGFGHSDKGGKNIWDDRLHIHKFIGGAASYLFAQRLNADAPGLLVFPGEGTSWEFYNHAPASLSTPYRWEGIPLVYVYSRAVIEREGWGSWVNGHSSAVLEPGDSRMFQTRFVPCERDRYDSVHQTLAACGQPAMKLLPGAVAPADVGIALEVGGSTPARFFLNREADLETDSDEDGGFCFIRPKESGTARLSFEDTKGRHSHAHLLFIEPIQLLIQKRADWIMKNQVLNNPNSVLDAAFLVANVRTGEKLENPEEYGGPFAVEGGLADALYLAEKNSIYPVREEIAVLDRFIDDFLRDDLQNPGDFSVGSAFADGRSVALNYAQPYVYALVFNLYHAMYRLARVYGETRQEPLEYLKLAANTAYALLRRGIPRHSRGTGLPGYARIFELLSDIANEGLEDDVERVMPLVSNRAEDLLKRNFPYHGEPNPDTAGFEEIFTSARYLNNDEMQERAMRYAFAARSLAPSWWWYGADSRFWDDTAGLPHPALADKGELSLSYSTSGNSLMFFSILDRDYGTLPEAYMRLAFGGLLSVWGLVRADGAASMGYCPDAASRHYGASHLTGDVGFALFQYLRGVGAYVLPSRNYGVFTFGCHFEVEDEHYTVRPWDGVGRRVIMRQVGAEFSVNFGRILEVRLDTRKRWAQVALESSADKDVWAELRVKGLWGNLYEVAGRTVEAVEGEVAVSVPIAAYGSVHIDIKVIG